MRSINAIIPNEERVEDSPWGRMRALLNAKTQREYYELCELLIGLELVQNMFRITPN